MTGLEKIIEVIEADAKANADAVIAEAEKEAEGMIAAAKTQAERKCAEITMNSKSDAGLIINRAESGAVLLEKNMILNAKQQMIREIIAKAKDKLMNLPASEYFEVILKIIKKYAHNKPGKIIFSAADLKRMPQKYNISLNAAVAELPEAALTIAEETVDINGGFILVYGDIEENCSFDALFAAAKEELQDKVNDFLFAAADPAAANNL